MEELKWLGRRGATCFDLTSPAVVLHLQVIEQNRLPHVQSYVLYFLSA